MVFGLVRLVRGQFQIEEGRVLGGDSGMMFIFIYSGIGQRCVFCYYFIGKIEIMDVVVSNCFKSCFLF